jgi:hypothetical protein
MKVEKKDKKLNQPVVEDFVKGIVIISAQKNDLKIMAKLAHRLGLPVKTLSDNDLLDLGLLKAMEEGRKNKFVSNDRIMSKLKKTR